MSIFYYYAYDYFKNGVFVCRGKIITVAVCLLSLNMYSNAKLNREDMLAAPLRARIAQLCIVAAISNEEKNQEFMQRWAEWQPLQRLDHEYAAHLIQDEKVGGVIFFGGNTTAQEQFERTNYFQSLTDEPLFIALDAELGLSSRLDVETVTRFPRNMTLGAVQDPQLMYQLGYEIGCELQAIGVHINCAPVVDVNYNPLNPIIGNRSYSSDPELVALLGIAFMRGLQDAGIITSAKHFPGHGDTTADSHEQLPLISHDLQRLTAIELYPFKKMIEAGVKSIMLAHLEVPALEKEPGMPSSLSYAVVTTLLQQQMNFNGLIVTDALCMKGVTEYAQSGEVELKALLAGADIILCPVDPVKAIDCIEQAVHNGIISEDEINRRVIKVMQAKQWAFERIVQRTGNLQEQLQSGHAGH